jgi:crotonobetainyl-CoA:carnitine CoA-transferase CaiB-like acyl-CoA transferase
MEARGVLRDVRVIDFGQYIAGPLAAMLLADQGADVIRVDPPTGPRWNTPANATWNRNKRSIALDLKNTDDRAIARKLIAGADVVIENFRPGVMERLGLGAAAMTAANPRLIYCSLPGFGHDDPRAHVRAYDQIIQGFSGLMSLTGDKGTAPMRAGYVVCDTMAAMTAAFAVCAALFRKATTGEGEMIDVSMLDASLSTMASWVVSNYLNAAKVPQPMGNENHTAAPSGTYRTGKGLINIVVNEERHFLRLCEVIDRPQFKTDPRFCERDIRIANRELLRGLLEEALQAKSAAEWERLFDEAGVPAGPILTIPEIVAHSQVEQRGLIKHFENVKDLNRDLRVTRAGFRLSQDQPDVAMPPPQLGQDTARILKTMGFTDAELDELRREGVI